MKRPTEPAWKAYGPPGYPLRGEDFSVLVKRPRRIRYVRGKARVLS